MKGLVKKWKSFNIFDFRIPPEFISSQFLLTHTKLQAETPHWSTIATKQKLIFQYWYRGVATHFLSIFSLATLVTLLCRTQIEWRVDVLSILIGAVVSYTIIYYMQYKPYFINIFLPHLETVKESYEQKHKEQMENCRKAQLSNLALVLVFYTFGKASSLQSLQCNDHSAKSLMLLFGVDPGSIKKSLSTIYGRKDNLTNRKLTEIANSFEEAFSFFERIEFLKGVELLMELEQKFVRLRLRNETSTNSN